MHAMNKLKVLTVVACLAPAAFAATVELTVGSGVTNTLAEALAAESKVLNPNDTLVKKGPGVLTTEGSPLTASDALTVNVNEGVLSLKAAGQLGKDGQITVASGATLKVNGGLKVVASRRLEFAGVGAVGEAGAVVMTGTANYEIMSGVTFVLSDDAVIAAESTGQWGLFSYAILSMNNHVLTLKGAVASGLPEFRFRFAATINNSAGILLDKAYLTSTPKANGAHTCSPTIPFLWMKNGSKMSSGTADSMMLGCFRTFDCDSDAQILMPNWELGVGGIIGSPTVQAANGSGTLAVLLVNGSLVARATDLNAGYCLTDACGLKFKQGAVFDVDDWSALTGGSKTYTAASAGSMTVTDNGIVMTNTNVYARHWALSNTGSALELRWSANAPVGVVSVTDWGIEPGAANASGNAAKFNAGIASVADNATVWFPAGDWYFDGALTLSVKSGVKIMGEESAARIFRTDSSADAFVTLSGCQGVTLEGLTLADCAGPAVAAQGGSGIVVTNIALSGVAGTISGVEGKYPFNAVDCTDFMVSDVRILSANAGYAAQVRLAGTATAAAACELQTTNIVLRAAAGENLAFATAFERTGLAAWPAGASLEKRGAGMVVASDSIKETVGSIYVVEGVLRASKNGDLGLDADSAHEISVLPGGSLLLTPEASDTKILNNRLLRLAGEGSASLAVPGALAFDTATGYQVIYNSSIALEADAVISSVGTAGQNGLFTFATLNMKGNRLTLACGADTQANFRFRSGRTIQNPGEIVIARAKLSTTTDEVTFPLGAVPKLTLVRGGTLSPGRLDFFNGFTNIVADGSGRVNAESAFAPTLQTLSGPLLLDKNVTATVSGGLGVKLSDILDGKTLAASNTLTFASSARLLVDADVEAPALTEDSYVLATSATGIAGRPRAPGLTLDGRKWTTAVSNDGKSLLLIPAAGLIFRVR